MQQQEDKLSLDIVTPTEHLVYKRVDEVNIPGSEGDFGVLLDHTPFLTTLRPGVLTYRIGKESHCLAVGAGFAEVIPRRVIVLAQTAETSDSISEQRAKDAQQRARERLEKASKGAENIDVRRAEMALARAIARLSASSFERSRL